MSKVDVTIIIPVYNDQEKLSSAIHSINTQSGGLSFEILIIDDGSTKPIQVESPNRFTIVRHSKNLGAAAARNTGMKIAKGDYIAFLDADDSWSSNKLEKQTTIMKDSSDEIVGVFTPFCYENNLEKIYNSTLNISDWFHYFSMGCRIAPGSTLLFKKILFKEIGPQDENLKQFEDWDWLLRASEKFKFTHITSAMTILGVSERTAYTSTTNSLATIEKKWSEISDSPYSRSFRSALQIEKAAVAFRKSKPLFVLYYLALSLIISPTVFFTNIIWKLTGRVTINKHKT